MHDGPLHDWVEAIKDDSQTFSFVLGHDCGLDCMFSLVLLHHPARPSYTGNMDISICVTERLGCDARGLNEDTVWVFTALARCFPRRDRRPSHWTSGKGRGTFLSH